MSTPGLAAWPVLAFNAPGFWEMAFLAVLALLIFGPERLPKMARNAGEMIARFKREAAGTIDELKAAAELEDFSDVARDLRTTRDELRRDLAVGPSAPASARVKPPSGAMAQSDPGPPPFDPDAP